MKNRIDFVNNNIRYYHADALGSIIALTDESGSVKARYNYSPFGQTEIVLDTDGSGAANPFRFTGREHDETGDYYYRARYYSPEMGRFLSEDPIRFAGGDVNWYAYAFNNPVNFTDLLGLDPRPPIGAEHLADETGANSILRCHVNPHLDPMENAIGGAIIGGPLFLMTGAELTAGYELALLRYANAGGIGLNLYNKGKRVIGLDWHKFKSGGRIVNRPHFDIPPLRLKHWPWKK